MLKKTTDNDIAGFAFATLNTITYGLLPVFSHYFVQTIDPLLFGGLVTTIGSLPLILQLRIKNKVEDVFSKNFFPSLLTIALLTTIGSILFFVGTKLTSGINTGLLVQIEPFYALVLGAIILKEIISGKQVMAISLMVLGAIVVVFKGLDSLNLGDIFIFAAPAFFQISHLVAKKIINKVSDINVIPTARLFYSGIILIALALILNPNSFKTAFTSQNLISIIIFALIFRTLDMYLWYQAIGRISVAQASSLIPLCAVISFLGSMLFLKEIPSPQQYIGLLLILGGLTWLSIIYLKLNKNRPSFITSS